MLKKSALIFYGLVLFLAGLVLPVFAQYPTATPPISNIGVYFSPQTATVPPETTMRIMMNSGGRGVSFARVVFNFDPSLIRLTSEITPNPNLSTVVEKTSMATANASGHVVIVIAASPSDIPPNGIFEFASFGIDSNTSLSNLTGDITFDILDGQIVDEGGSQIPATYVNASININSGSFCPRGSLGNLNCSADGCIDTADYEIFRQAFGKTQAEIIVPSGQASPDLVQDNNNIIDTADYEIIRANFGSCQ